VLWALTCFFSLQLGLAAAIECWLMRLRDPFYAGKSARLHRLAEDGNGDLARRSSDWTLNIAHRPPHERSSTLIVMLGSSRTAYGMNGRQVSEYLTREHGRPMTVFNFGIPAAGPLSQLLSLNRLLEEGIRPDLLLVEVLPPLLAGQGPMPVEANWLIAHRLKLGELTIMERQGYRVKELRRDWWQAWPVPWFSHRFALVSRWLPIWLPWNLREDWTDGPDAWGWTPTRVVDPTPEGYRRVVEIARRQYQGYLSSFRLSEPTCRAQRELLEICRREQIPVALVLMPEGSLFRSWYPPATWQTIQAFLDGLQADYGVALIDARRWIADDYFSDTHHLLCEGSTLFSERLGKELETMLQRQVCDKAATKMGCGR
jgi:hypothetical protein